MIEEKGVRGRIAMTVDPDQQGHLSSFTTLARRLEKEGYQVSFVGVVDDKEKVEKSGFTYQVVAEDLFPLGAIEKLKKEAFSRSGSIFKKMKDGKAFQSKMDEMLKTFANEISGQYDLVIADGMVSHAPLVASKAKVPFITLHATVPFDNPLSPSVLFSEPPNLNGTLSLKNKIAKSKYRRLFTFNPIRIISHLFMMAFSRILMGSREANHKKLQQKFDFTDAFFPRQNASLAHSYPALVPYPQKFDFNLPTVPETFYIDALIEEDNQPNDFDFDFLNQGKTVVFAAMGSQSHNWMKRFMGTKFYEMLISTFERRDDCVLVLAAGIFTEELKKKCNAKNIKIVNWAPQKQILKKADMMITHCGIHSVKECIHNKVPMLCFPVMGDQTGAAARVKYHRLGVVGSVLKTTQSQLDEMLNEISKNPVYKLSLARMKKEFDLAAEKNEVLNIISEAICKEPDSHINYEPLVE